MHCNLNNPQRRSAPAILAGARISSPNIRTLLTIVAATYWLALFAATHVPVVPEALQQPGADKWAHTAAYAGLSFLLAARQATATSLTWKVAARVLLLVAVYGIVDELTQIPVGRHAELGDWLADLRGALVGVGLAAILQAGIDRSSRPRGGRSK